MGAMASQITSVAIVYSTVYSGADQRKHQSSASLAICAGNSPVAENVSIWWRHHTISSKHTTLCSHSPIWKRTQYYIMITNPVKWKHYENKLRDFQVITAFNTFTIKCPERASTEHIVMWWETFQTFDCVRFQWGFHRIVKFNQRVEKNTLWELTHQPFFVIH